MPVWGIHKKKNLPDSLLKRDRIMSSSKSGIIFSDAQSGTTDTAQQPEKNLKTQKSKKKNRKP